ncbi:MAG: hypothetical protein JW716_01315 [Candidatus Aenigmarchaeota archaeon]|nr:hypothetical protein [Candidatus Aenigmarchaeota archaeon]
MRKVTDYRSYEAMGSRVDSLFEQYKTEQGFFADIKKMLTPRFVEYASLHDSWTEQTGDIIIRSIPERRK